MNITAFWDITSCNLEEIDGRFEGDYCLHHQDDESLMCSVHGEISEKAVIFILAALIVRNPT
jgi:hypothetical protein